LPVLKFVKVNSACARTVSRSTDPTTTKTNSIFFIITAVFKNEFFLSSK
jgi:hypothetical protein